MSAVDWQTATATLERFPGVVAAWVFGSAVRGVLGPGSDLDLGVLFDAPPTLEKQADLRAALQRALGVEEIDLTVLPCRSPLLAMEAVSGRRLLCRDPGRTAAYVSLVAREAEDESAFLRRSAGVRN